METLQPEIDRENAAMTNTLDEYYNQKYEVRHNLSLTPNYIFSAIAEIHTMELQAEVALGQRNPKPVKLDD